VSGAPHPVAAPPVSTPLTIASATLLLAVPFVAFLHFNRYGFWQPEVAALLLVLALVGALLGMVMAWIRSPLGGALVSGALVLFSFDLLANVEGREWPLFAAAVGVCWLLRAHLHRLIVIVMLAMLVATLAGAPREPRAQRWDRAAEAGTASATRDGAAATPRPSPLLHLILDEHVGVDGIPLDVAGGEAAREALVRSYVARGFRLYTRAYSQYYLTADALPNALNFTRSAVEMGWLGGPSTTFPATLARNRYFERLTDAGYRLRIYQPSFIDFCRAAERATDACYQVPANAVFTLGELPLDWPQRAGALARHWITSRSTLLHDLHTFYTERLRPRLGTFASAAPAWEWPDYKLGPAAAFAVLRQMGDDMHARPTLDATAWFGHVLLPHRPYMLEQDCRLSANPYTGNAPEKDRGRDRQQKHADYYPRYFPQLRCLTARVDSLLTLFDARGGAGGVVIVHGDHGARIHAPVQPPDVPLTRADFEDVYSTLFAVRAPGIEAGIDSTVVSIRTLLDHLSATGFADAAVSPEAEPVIFRPPAGMTGRRIAVPIPPRDIAPEPPLLLRAVTPTSPSAR
jgi:hypothetical protein